MTNNYPPDPLWDLYEGKKVPMFHMICKGVLYRKDGNNGEWYQVGEQIDICGEFTLFTNIKKVEEEINNNILDDKLFELE
jgi:hypothetical protein